VSVGVKAEGTGGQVVGRKKHHLRVSPVASKLGCSIRAEDATDQPLLWHSRCRGASRHQDAVLAGAASETKELFLVCGRQGCDCRTDGF